MLKRSYGGRPGTATTYLIVLSIGLGSVLIARSGLGVQLSPASSRSGLELESIDRAVDPCSDFYQFACGRWIAAHPVPPDLAGIGRAREIRTRTFQVLSKILTTPGRDRERQKAKLYYDACMDEATIEAKGLTPLDVVLRRITEIRTREELPALIAFLHSVAFTPPAPGRPLTYRALFEFRSHYQLPNNVAAINPSGVALPSRDLYLAKDARSLKLRTAYTAHLRDIFVMLGASTDAATAAADAVLAIETALASASLDSLQLRAAQSRRMSVEELQTLTPHFNWTEYLAAARAPATPIIEVVTPGFVKAVDAVVADMPFAAVKSYLQWQVAHASVVMMPRRFRQADSDFFNRVLRGQPQLPSRSEICVIESDERLGGIVGKAFTEETFGEKSKADLLRLINTLNASMKQTIDAASWLSDATKIAARTKLAAMIARIGFPDRWPNYSNLELRSGDAVGNFQRALAFERGVDLQKIGRPSDRSEWPRISITMGEPGYRPELNAVVFPAGFLQPPMYDARRDAAVNYGAIGAMIGHEITHAFDDVGRRLDEQGRWRDWWTAADAAAFQDRAACLVGQYSQYEVASGVNVNGRLTLGENIADSGGIRVALLAYLAGPGRESQAMLDGFTPAQRVFLGWAQAWCQNVRPEVERLSVTVDPHAPGRYRVNGPLSNMPDFQTAFSCKPDSPMVRPKACRVW